MKKTLFVLLSLWAAVVLAGISGKVVGVVKNAITGDGLPGVNVMIEETGLGAVSASDGQFFIMNVPPGSYRVRATLIGFKMTTVEQVRVKIDQTTAVNFNLNEEALKGEQITIVAEKPKVEVDLTASKQALSKEEINRSWGNDLETVISDIPGVNINGGIRGGFGLDVAYHLDGMDMRDIASNTNFSSINLSTIQEVEVLTGGWNAEYGQANGAIINVVSKRSTDRLHAVASYKMRPPGVFHWGSNIYDEDDFFHTIMTTPNFWNPDSVWQSEWMDTTQAGFAGGVEPFKSMTSEERAAWWQKFVNSDSLHPQNNYAERMDWESEITLFGPISRNMGFMLSGRFKEGVPRYPSPMKYNPELTLQAALNFKPTSKVKVDVSGVYTKFENSGASRTNFASSEDTFHDDQGVPYIMDPYSVFKYWMYGSYSSSNFTIRAPEYANLMNLQGKLTWVINPQTFLEVAVQHSEMKYWMDYREIMRTTVYGTDGLPLLSTPESLPVSILTFKWGTPGDFWLNKVYSRNSTFKADFTSQLSSHHQLKSGMMFSYQKMDKILHDSQQSGTAIYAQMTDLADTKSYPYEGALYVQDKMEFEGMVINAGLRMDFFNANKNVSANIFDPLMISDSTVGHVGDTGHISWDPEGEGLGYQKTPTRIALSPRLGISHPIGENTVLHFMYGHFNQRPPWQKIVGPTVVRTLTPTTGLDANWHMNPDSQVVIYNYYTQKSANPGLTWEKMIQYEVGVEQNIADLVSLDVTMYYKDAHNLTSRGISQGPTSLNIAGSGGDVNVYLYGDPLAPKDRIIGETQGYFITSVNGAWADVRGIEATVSTRFNYFNVKANYTLSFLNTGSYHLSEIYKEWNGKKTGDDVYNGASNFDNGQNGLDDDTWNPHNAAVIRLSLATPKKFGWAINRFHPLAQWQINTSTSWTQGQVFTYHSPDDKSTTLNNRRWRDRWNTNLNLAKILDVYNGITCKLSLQVTNLFNQKHLRLPSGTTALTDYFEESQLSVQSTTREPMVWNWYYNFPREAYFGLTVEF